MKNKKKKKSSILAQLFYLVSHYSPMRFETAKEIDGRVAAVLDALGSHNFSTFRSLVLDYSIFLEYSAC